MFTLIQKSVKANTEQRRPSVPGRCAPGARRERSGAEHSRARTSRPGLRRLRPSAGRSHQPMPATPPPSRSQWQPPGGGAASTSCARAEQRKEQGGQSGSPRPHRQPVRASATAPPRKPTRASPAAPLRKPTRGQPRLPHPSPRPPRQPPLRRPAREPGINTERTIAPLQARTAANRRLGWDVYCTGSFTTTCQIPKI